MQFYTYQLMEVTYIQNESRLIYEIMQELGKHGAVFRTNAGSIRLPNGKVFRGLPKGFSDILFIGRDGKACFVEAKVKPNKPEPEQIKFIEKMQSMGCLAGVAYSVDEAIHICSVTKV
ncbi:VRR-NUC domain-containing protein [Ruminococcaceae bacterium OttesenSCG-928-L11]|nr:VRR-NUC domain-containing protein [Ruminococcaceae bacterium OttesenSCG-928-L11]